MYRFLVFVTIFLEVLGSSEFEWSLFSQEEIGEIERDFHPHQFSTTIAPERPWRRERVMLFEMVRGNQSVSLEFVLGRIRNELPETTITLDMLGEDRDTILRVPIVPKWFHTAMMTLGFYDTLNLRAIPLLLALAPAGSWFSFDHLDTVKRVAIGWFSLCVRPTQLNLPGGPFCSQISQPGITGEYAEAYSLSQSQMDIYMTRLEAHLRRP